MTLALPLWSRVDETGLARFVTPAGKPLAGAADQPL
jgi:hypothetical protein